MSKVEPDWVARGIGIGATIIALGSLGWQVYSWRHTGPVVKVRAWCTGRGPEMKLRGTLVSAGRADARVVRASFEWQTWAGDGAGGGSRKVSCKLPADHLGGIELPLPMPIQADPHEFAVLAIEEIDPGLWTALHERRMVKLVFHTPTGRASATIKYRT